MGSEYKAIMDHQLLRRIPETGSTATLATFGGSCSSCAGATHHVNEALRGMWHEVALGSWPTSQQMYPALGIQATRPDFVKSESPLR
jgi:hypothetical protein